MTGDAASPELPQHFQAKPLRGRPFNRDFSLEFHGARECTTWNTRCFEVNRPRSRAASEPQPGGARRFAVQVWRWELRQAL